MTVCVSVGHVPRNITEDSEVDLDHSFEAIDFTSSFVVILLFDLNRLMRERTRADIMGRNSVNDV